MTIMGKQPFITADLRPDLSVETNAVERALGVVATTEQVARAAHSVLDEGERLQVERGNKDGQARLLDYVPKPNPNVQGTVLDGETVLLDLSTGRYYTLNRVGTAVWEACTGSMQLGQIHAVLCARFEASSERIADDLIALVTQLSHEGLVTLEGR
jgi:hypothetical protein